MAKRKAAARPKAEAASAATASAARVTVINLKGSAALRDWLAGISDRTMIPAAAITRAGLAEWAKRNGHPTPPPQ